MQEPLEWLPDGAPYNPRYGDVYHSRAGALAQARAVFLAGCSLPALWQEHADWRILETGFGLGLNFLATWAACSEWSQGNAQQGGTLHFISIEAHPVSAQDLLRGLQRLHAGDAADAALLPRVQALVAQLAAAWAGLRPGLQDWAFDEGRVRLTLGVGDVRDLLHVLPGQLDSVDAVYLDGFSPARNPAMWSAEVMQGVARLCRPGTRLASWCVAGQVRARLQQAGFEVSKQPGLPPKRHRLEACYRVR
jgi:tRNA 5-methylaminomethyl-2-thiouridine biosynthesis bifunctional protein